MQVETCSHRGLIHADIRTGANLNDACRLKANTGISFMGVKLHGQGFVVENSDALVNQEPKALKKYLVGNELNQKPKHHYVIDFFGLSVEDARRKFPKAFQRLVEQVKPGRDQSQRQTYKTYWWLFGEKRPEMRNALTNLARFIAICRTAKHFVFRFVPGDVLLESKGVAFAHQDAFVLGLLSSHVHVTWATQIGSRHGKGNDLTYNNTLCFETFPFPNATELQKAGIRLLAEELDAHRKARLAEHDELTITGMYNVLSKICAGEALTAKEKVIHDQGLVATLRLLHDDLDEAVLAAYGWSADLGDDEILTRLVALNAQRAEEEARGVVRWLRPELQNPGAQGVMAFPKAATVGHAPLSSVSAASSNPWPGKLAEQVVAVRKVFDRSGSSWTTARVAQAFSGASVAEIDAVLESLSALGHLVTYQQDEAMWWATPRAA